MKAKFLCLVLPLIVLGVHSPVVAQTAPMRQPLGIYFRMAIIPESGAQITNDVLAPLTNPAVSGILAVFAWKDLSFPSADPTVGSNNFQIVDDVFGAVALWNSTNTNNPKSVQLEVTPGFKTPAWVLSNLPSCDGLFRTNSDGLIVDSNAEQGLFLVGVNPGFTNTNCGCATFYESESAGQPHPESLPLPWNNFYKDAWKSFIQALVEKYETNQILVSIAVDGPTASTAEMILPNEQNDTTNYLKWNPLFAFEFPDHPEYTNSDTLFIKAWKDAIDMFGESFSNITLVVTTGSGLPNFLDTNGMPDGNYSIPPGFCPICDTNNQASIMDCAAEATILAYFADPANGGNNAKAAQSDHLSAGGVKLHPLGGGDLGDHGIRWLAQNTASGNAPLPGTTNVVSRVLGGSQVGGSGGTGDAITTNPDIEGCPDIHNDCTNIPPEQAVYNVLSAYFDGTLVGNQYNSTLTSSNFPLNYFQIYADDILYANTNATGSVVTNGSGETNMMTVETLLTNANVLISEIAELGLNIEPAGQNVQLTWLASAAGTQLQVNHDLSKPDGWTTAPQSPTRTNNFNQILLDPKANQSFYRLATPLTPPLP
jgi:hypothetical protein